jgi:Protein of unknown function (DUF2621)
MTKELPADEGIDWDKTAREDFEAVLGKIPLFLRDIARKKVSKKAEKNAIDDNRRTVTPKDVVDASFMETPFGFHGPMKMDMEALGIDYQKYGYPR